MANILGISQGAYSHLETGRTQPMVSHLQALISELQLDPGYFFGDKTEYSQTEEVHEVKETDQFYNLDQRRAPSFITVDNSGRENILMVNSKAYAGYTTNLQEVEYLSHLPAFGLPLPEFRNGTFRAFQASGSSMEETIYNGDWLICEFVDDWNRSIKEGRIYVVVTKETILVKRLLNRLSQGKLVIQSDNPQFSTDFVDAEDVMEVWHLRMSMSKMFPNSRYDAAKKIADLESDMELIKRELGLSGFKKPTKNLH